MNALRWISIPLILGLALPPVGCGLFRRRRGNVSTSVNSSVSISQQDRDIATLQRDEYEVIETSIGANKARSIFFLTLPVGSHTTHEEQVDSAYYQAVDRIPECDALMMPRVDTKRIFVPLLIVNIVIRKTQVKGRCVHIKDDATPTGEEPATEGTGGSPDVPETPDTPEPPPAEPAAG